MTDGEGRCEGDGDVVGVVVVSTGPRPVSSDVKAVKASTPAPTATAHPAAASSTTAGRRRRPGRPGP
ncbi:hypothetical protein, partial [Microbispora sp. ATCC PTA-5024]|uniref:hypothetical protein n=1 Tax=Microbispora sp. ATCC PTA-5024 TaxID=316330 RepID=UPI0018DC962A